MIEMKTESPPAAAGTSRLLPRVLTALIGIPIAIGLIYLGGWPFVLGALAVVWMAQFEFYRMAPVALRRYHLAAGFAGGGCAMLHAFGLPYLADAAVLLFLILLLFDLFDRSGENVWQQTAWTIAGVVYPVLLFSYIVRLRTGWSALDDGMAFWFTMTPLILVWATDSLAYFTGRALGKRPLAPAISPKKTWEGTLGGFAGALLAAAALKWTVLEALPWVHTLAAGSLAGVAGQLGDLVESRLKRLVHVKDSGALLPGHGGMLDRIDSLLVVLPAVYLYLVYVAGLG